MFGKILNYEVSDNKVQIDFEGNKGTIEIISPSIINVFSPLKYKEHYSRAIEDVNIKQSKFNVCKDDEKIAVETEDLIIYVYNNFKVDFYNRSGQVLCQDYRGKREPFSRGKKSHTCESQWVDRDEPVQEHKIEIIKKMNGDESFYGFGEKTGHLNKKNYYYEMWNTDNPAPHVESFEVLYKSVPFFITLRNELSFGIFFDNTFRTYFDMGKENSSYYYFAADDGNLDYYFIYGPKVTEVITHYTYLTGRCPLPQMWTLGYHQCRWSYYPEDKVMDVARGFREKNIPCESIFLDIDYMDGYRVFTWDKNKFANPKKMIENLKNEGFKVVTIIDPGVKKDKGYSIYDEGMEKGFFAEKDGEPYVNEVWPGEAVYPDFSDERVRKWWAENQKIMIDYGVSGIWNDMNEPASFNGPLPDDVVFDNDGRKSNHLEIHNVYGHLMAKAAYEGVKKYTNKRPFIITRACYAGTQKYSTVWTGDNHSLWEHLKMSLPMLMNLGLSGFAFCGADVGGFQFDCTPELLSRWVQVGCFTPLFRNHSHIYTRFQEPWAFDKATEEINKKYIDLRYRLLPYLYDLMYETEKSGIPVIRPLMLHYQDDRNTYEMNDEFLFGQNILVAPVLEQGKMIKAVYVPQGTWIDYWTKEIHYGGKYIIKDAPLDVCPIFVKEGSIIPNYTVQNYIGEKKQDELILEVYPGQGKYIHYKDDGESFNYRDGQYNLYEFTMQYQKEFIIRMNKIKNGYEEDYRSFRYKVFNIKAKQVKVNGQSINFYNSEDFIEFQINPEEAVIEIIVQ